MSVMYNKYDNNFKILPSTILRIHVIVVIFYALKTLSYALLYTKKF